MSLSARSSRPVVPPLALAALAAAGLLVLLALSLPASARLALGVACVAVAVPRRPEGDQPPHITRAARALIRRDAPLSKLALGTAGAACDLQAALEVAERLEGALEAVCLSKAVRGLQRAVGASLAFNREAHLVPAAVVELAQQMNDGVICPDAAVSGLADLRETLEGLAERSLSFADADLTYVVAELDGVNETLQSRAFGRIMASTSAAGREFARLAERLGKQAEKIGEIETALGTAIEEALEAEEEEETEEEEAEDEEEGDDAPTAPSVSVDHGAAS